MNVKLAKSFGLGAIVALALVASVVSFELVVARQGASNCPVLAGSPTSFASSGFLMSERIGKSDNMQFVIKPNSTAFLEIDYYVGISTAQNIYANRSQYFVPIPSWAKIGSNSPSPLRAIDVGLFARPVNVSVTGNHTLTANYQITASETALVGAYYGYFWSTCGPQIVITVGTSFYTGAGLEGGTYF